MRPRAVILAEMERHQALLNLFNRHLQEFGSVPGESLVEVSRAMTTTTRGIRRMEKLIRGLQFELQATL